MPPRPGIGQYGHLIRAGQEPDDGGLSVLQQHLANIKRKAALQQAQGLQAPPGEASQQIYQPLPDIREPETRQENLSFQSLMSGHPILGPFAGSRAQPRVTTIDPNEPDMWKGMSTYTPTLHRPSIQDEAFRQRLMQSDIYKQLSAPPLSGQGGTSFEEMMLQVGPSGAHTTTERTQFEEALRRNLFSQFSPEEAQRRLDEAMSRRATATRQPSTVTTPQGP